MPTVLHVIDAVSPQACAATLALIAATRRHVRAFDHEVLLLGGAALQRQAQAAELTGAIRIGVPGGCAVLGAAAVARATRGRSFDAIHCWSLGTWKLMSLLRRKTPHVLCLTQPTTDAAAIRSVSRKLRRPRQPRSMVITLSDTIRDALLAGGAPAEAVVTVTPAIDTALLDPGERSPLRGGWTFDHADTRVVALLGDPPAAVDARKANLGVGLAHESLRAALGRRPSLRLFMHPDQFRRLPAQRMMINYGVGDVVAQEARVAAPWLILPGCDGALILGQHAGGLATCWAMAAGLPIVAETPSPADQYLRNQENALLADRDQPKRLAHRLHQLILDQPLAREIGEAARRDARDLFDPTVYGQRVAAVYESLVG